MFDIVTGGTGFLGSHLVNYLTSLGRKVIVLQSKVHQSDEYIHPFKNSEYVQVIVGDICEDTWWASLSELPIQRVFHLAANASVPRSAKDPINDLKTNIGGTLTCLQLAKKQNAKFLLASTASVYGNPVYTPMDEEHPLNPISHYGVSKLSAEFYTNLYGREYGVDTHIIRLFNVFGPRQPRYIIFDFFRKALDEGDTFEVLGDGKQVRTQLYVEDAVQAIELVMRKGDNKPYNVGSATTFTALDLAHKVLTITKREKPIITSGSSWSGDIPIMIPKVERLQQLGFTKQLTFEQGLEKVWLWWQENYV